MKKIRQRNRHKIEFEYDSLNRELKSNNDYNLKQYLHEKKSLRNQMGIVKDESNEDSIAEMITSQNLSNSHGKKGDGFVAT